MPVTLDNQVVLVLGASSGIGRAAAMLFAREGARVIAAARREDRLRDLQNALRAEGRSIEVAAADVSSPDEMQRLGDRSGAVDILVYSTGDNIPDRSLKRLNVERWDRMLAVNLSGAYYITRALLPGMRERRAGHLIYVSSISACYADASGAAYQAAKRGLLGMAHAIRFEEKENGIRTCVVFPGLVETELLAKRPFQTPAETVAKAMQPEDVADAILAVAKLPPRACVPEIQVLPTLL